MPTVPHSPLTADRLVGKAGIVTGAGQGIGASIAIALAEAGVKLVLNDINPDTLAATVEKCQSFGVEAEALAGDIGAIETSNALVNKAIESFGTLDLAVANAAYSKRELMTQADLDEFQKTIQVTMWGPFYVTRTAAQQMQSQGNGGSIVVVSSPHAHNPIPGAMAYNMAKAATDQMAKTAACELSRDRIRVNLIHPGWVNTPGERRFFSEEKIERLGQELPWGRLANPDEIARGVLFLCDPQSEYITGSTVTIDGGIQLPFREMHRVEDR